MFQTELLMCVWGFEKEKREQWWKALGDFLAVVVADFHGGLPLQEFSWGAGYADTTPAREFWTRLATALHLQKPWTFGPAKNGRENKKLRRDFSAHKYAIHCSRVDKSWLSGFALSTRWHGRSELEWFLEEYTSL